MSFVRILAVFVLIIFAGTSATFVNGSVKLTSGAFAKVLVLALLYKPPSLFELKLIYSYVIEVADSESDLGFFQYCSSSEIFEFYHLLEYSRGRPGRRGHVHLGHNFFIQIFYSKFFNIFSFIRFMRVMRVYVGYLLLRVFVRYLLLRVYVGYLL